MKRFLLSGMSGNNPLGFLAALGALVTLQQAGEKQVRLAWKRSTTWHPELSGVAMPDRTELARTIAAGLRGRAVSEQAEEERKRAQAAFDAVKKEIKNREQQIRRRGLDRRQQKEALETELVPLERERERRRSEWLRALGQAVPRPELALGKSIDCSVEEYRQHAEAFLKDADGSARETLDLFAALGSDAGRDEADKVEPTPFCFVKGSGNQYFLDTVRQLMAQVTPERVEAVLFEPWAYRDEKLSLRWDPIEDRQYALMDQNPSDDSPQTEWMANLLAYRALALLPSAAGPRGPDTAGWSELEESGLVFTWPLWYFDASPDLVRTMLGLEELLAPRPDRELLRARGIEAVYRVRRIKVGSGANYKLNFSPARAV